MSHIYSARPYIGFSRNIHRTTRLVNKIENYFLDCRKWALKIVKNCDNCVDFLANFDCRSVFGTKKFFEKVLFRSQEKACN